MHIYFVKVSGLSRQYRRSIYIILIVNSDATGIINREIICAILSDHYIYNYSANAGDEPQPWLINLGSNKLVNLNANLVGNTNNSA